MANKFIVVGALVIIAGLGGFMWSNRALPSNTSVSDHHEELDEIRSELKQLRESRNTEQLLAAHLATGRQTGEPQRVASIPAESHKSSQVDDPTLTAQQKDEEKRQNIVSHLDREFDSQRLDSSWSRVATNEATAALSTGLPEGSTIVKVDCRSTLCRVETTHKNADALRAYNQTAFAGRDRKLWNAAVFSTIRSESPSGVQAVSFIAKEGENMPLPEREAE